MQAAPSPGMWGLQQRAPSVNDHLHSVTAIPQTAPRYILAHSKVYCNFCPGYCCYRLAGATLYLNAKDINRIARHFGISDGEVRKRWIIEKNTFLTREDGSCIFLANGKLRARCSIHEARARQCREFPYDEPCPYLEREDLLGEIQARIKASLSADD